jgi:hypothetical protein
VRSGISLLALQRMLEIETYKTLWTMGHKISQTQWDTYYKLAGLIEIDDTYFGAPKSGKRGGATGKAKVVVKTDGWQGYSFLVAAPSQRHEWLVPGAGKAVVKVLPWVHTLIANIKGTIGGVHHGVSPKHLPRILRNSAIVSTAVFGNRQCPTACRMLASTLQALLSRS